MTCQKQAEGALRAVVPFADGATVRHRVTKRTGIVVTRTTEEPPRYVLLEQGLTGHYEPVVKHHELEALDVVAPERPSGMPTLPNPFTFLRNPETFADFINNRPLFSTPFGSPTHYPKPADPRAVVKNDAATGPHVIEWRDASDKVPEVPDARNGLVNGRRRFTVIRNPYASDPAKPWSGFDHDAQQIGPHVATAREAQDWCAMRVNPEAKGTIYFSGEDKNGQRLSDCRRFVVTRFGDRYQAEDTRDKVYSGRFATMQEAFKWCLDRRRGEGNVNEPTPKLENVPGLEWGDIEPGAWLYDTTRRFRIDMMQAVNKKPNPLHHATDLKAEPGRRVSPVGTLDEVKEWCEDRAAERSKPAGRLAWADTPDADHWLWDSTRRFKIHTKYAPKNFLPFDTYAHSGNIRSPHDLAHSKTLDAAKAWAEERAGYDVVSENGFERLEPKGTAVPF